MVKAYVKNSDQTKIEVLFGNAKIIKVEPKE